MSGHQRSSEAKNDDARNRLGPVAQLSLPSRKLHSRLKNEFECELNLPLWDGGPDKDSREVAESSCSVEDVCITITHLRRREVRVVENVENLHPELYVKVF